MNEFSKMTPEQIQAMMTDFLNTTRDQLNPRVQQETVGPDRSEQVGNKKGQTVKNRPKTKVQSKTSSKEAPRLKFVADAVGNISLTSLNTTSKEASRRLFNFSAIRDNVGRFFIAEKENSADQDEPQVKIQHSKQDGGLYHREPKGNYYKGDLDKPQGKQGNDTGETMMNRSSDVHPMTPSKETPQRLFDFSAILNNVGRFFDTGNSANQDELQEITKDSPEDVAQSRCDQKRGDYVDDLDDPQETTEESKQDDGLYHRKRKPDNHKEGLDEQDQSENNTEETMMNQASKVHPETPSNEVQEPHFVADANGNIFPASFNADNSASHVQKENDTKVPRPKFVADADGNIFITSSYMDNSASQEQPRNGNETQLGQFHHFTSADYPFYVFVTPSSVPNPWKKHNDYLDDLDLD